MRLATYWIYIRYPLAMDAYFWMSSAGRVENLNIPKYEDLFPDGKSYFSRATTEGKMIFLRE